MGVRESTSQNQSQSQRRSESPVVYRPDKYEDKNKTDRDYMNSKKKRIELPESTKNDSMNASNIISSLI